MKAYSLSIALAALVALGGCGKKNDVHAYEHEATELAKYYAPQLDALDGRVDAIFKVGSKIPGNLPGIDEIGRKLQEARERSKQLRGIVGPGPDGKSALEKQAENAAKDKKITDLQKLVHDTERLLDEGLTIIRDDLGAVETWIANYERKTLAFAAPAAGETQPVASEPAAPAAPEAAPSR